MATMNDHRITSVAQLRSLISEPNAMVRMKVMSELDDLATDFITRSPFLVLSTADAEGNQDASPKGDHPGFVLVENPSTIVIPGAQGQQAAVRFAKHSRQSACRDGVHAAWHRRDSSG